MKKFITLDGVTREFTKEEYESEELELMKIAEKIENQKKQIEKQHLLESKFKDPYEALEKLCRHLKIDFETLED